MIVEYAEELGGLNSLRDWLTLRALKAVILAATP